MSEILSIGELLDLGNSAATAGLVPYSALEYDGTGRISGISGSAIAGGVDSAVVSSIVSSYVSSKVDQSAFDDCCSAMSSVVSSKLDTSASSLLQPIGDYYSASNPSGFISEADLSQYQEKSGMTAYQSAGNYYSASNPSGFLTGVDLSDYAKESSVSSKLDASASSNFQPTSSMSSYVPFSGLEYSAGTQTITAISGSAIGGGGAVSLASSYLIADSGLELTVDMDSAILKVSGVEPSIVYGYSNGLITSLNGSGIPTCNVIKETSYSQTTATVQSLDIIYTPSISYKAYGSGSASSVNTASSTVGYYPKVYFISGIEPSLPIPEPANRLSSRVESQYALYYFTMSEGVSACFGDMDISSPDNPHLYNTGFYSEGTPLPNRTANGRRKVIFFTNGYSYTEPSTFEGSALYELSANFIQVLKESACIVKEPTGWISANSTSMDVGPTKTYNGYVSSFSSFNGYYHSSQASANTRVRLSACSGWGPYSVHFAADVANIPGDTNWYLVQRSPVSGLEILDMCKTYGSSGSVRLDGVTFGRANGDYCSGVYVSSVTNGYEGDSGYMVANSMYCRGYQIPTGTVLTTNTSNSYSN